jgi:hypothetical protein
LVIEKYLPLLQQGLQCLSFPFCWSSPFTGDPGWLGSYHCAAAVLRLQHQLLSVLLFATYRAQQQQRSSSSCCWTMSQQAAEQQLQPLQNQQPTFPPPQQLQQHMRSPFLAVQHTDCDVLSSFAAELLEALQIVQAKQGQAPQHEPSTAEQEHRLCQQQVRETG